MPRVPRPNRSGEIMHIIYDLRAGLTGFWPCISCSLPCMPSPHHAIFNILYRVPVTKVSSRTDPITTLENHCAASGDQYLRQSSPICETQECQSPEKFGSIEVNRGSL